MTIDRKAAACAILSGLLLTASFPKLGLDWVAWFALVPLLVALREASASKSVRLGFLCGLFHFFSLLYWLMPTMHIYGYLPWYVCIAVLLLFAGVLAVFVAVFALALTRAADDPLRCWLMVPLLWVSLELLRSHIFTGFPWELLGYSQFKRLPVIQMADTFGVYGISFLIALGNATVFLAMSALTGLRWQKKATPKSLAAVAVSACLLLAGANWLYGQWRMRQVDDLAAGASTMRVAVVQGNIEQGRLWDPAFQLTTIKTYRKLSLSVQKDNPDLVVWPESAAPFYFLYDPAPTRLVLEGIRQTSTAYLIGSPAFSRNPDGAVNYYNRAYLIESDGEVGGTYDKAHLVPYGEYTPFKDYLPFIGKMVEHVGDFEPGKKGNVVFLNGIGLGIQICYEIIFPELARAMTRHGAAVLINITNDAWYGRSAGPYQHFSMVVFRAIENRRSLARAANTGISGFIDPAGRILNSTPLFVESALTGELPLLTTTTPYTRYGDFFAIACALISLLGIIRSLRTFRKFKFRRNR